MDSIKAFKEKLDNEHNWPAIYMFKFVVPVAKAGELRQLFNNEKLHQKIQRPGTMWLLP